MDGKQIKKLPVFNFSNNLPIISATIPADWERCLCNEYLDVVDFDDTASVIIITSTGYDIKHSYQIAQKFKSSGKIVILGVLMEQLSRQIMSDVIDSSFTGYPNPQSMRELLHDAVTNNLKGEYNFGIDLDFEFDYSVFNGQKMWFYPAMAGVGCKHSCTYCCYPQTFHGKYKVRSIDFVVKDLQVISEKCKVVGFLDANIYNDREHLIKLLKRIIALKINVIWGAQATIDIGDDWEVLQLMYNAGCRILFFGIETLDSQNMKQLNKHFDINDFPRQLKGIRNAGIRTGAFFMFGLDNDKMESFAILEKFLKDNKIDIPYLHLLIPMPGMGVFKQIDKEGRLNKKYYDEFMNCNPLYSIPCSKLFFQPKSMKESEVEEEYLNLYKKISSWSSIIRRTWQNGFTNALLMMLLNYDGRSKYKAMRKNYNKIKMLEDR